MNEQTRKLLRESRRAASAAQPDAGAFLLAQFQTLALPQSFICAGYVAIHDEINPAPIMAFLEARGARLCLPVLENENAPLNFRLYDTGDRLLPGKHHIPEPAADKETVTPDVVLTPLLGFDRAGNRMGYGKGYYDRTLAKLRAESPNVLAIGLAFAEQEVAEIIAQPHDQPLNIIVTPREVIYCPPT